MTQTAPVTIPLYYYDKAKDDYPRISDHFVVKEIPNIVSVYGEEPVALRVQLHADIPHVDGSNGSPVPLLFTLPDVRDGIVYEVAVGTRVAKRRLAKFLENVRNEGKDIASTVLELRRNHVTIERVVGDGRKVKDWTCINELSELI